MQLLFYYIVLNLLNGLITIGAGYLIKVSFRPKGALFGFYFDMWIITLVQNLCNSGFLGVFRYRELNQYDKLLFKYLIN